MKRLFLCAFICPALMCGWSAFKLRADPQTPHFTDRTLINTGPRQCREPSGIVFSPGRGTLFVIDDEGAICELQLDGTLVKTKRINRADLEGITLDTDGYLYIAEDSGNIIKYTFDATINHQAPDNTPNHRFTPETGAQ